MNVKCIFIDIDGTLLPDSKKVSDYTLKILNNVKSKGIFLVLASGRDLSDVQKISEDCRTSSIIISDNGASIYDYQKKVLISSSMFKMQEIKIIWNISIKYEIDIIFNSKECRYRHYFNLNKEYNENRDIIINSYQQIKSDIFQVILLGKNSIKLKRCVKEILLLNVKKSNHGTGKNGISFVDINKQNVSKGIAVKSVLKYLNIPKENTMCFGDSINDINMFDECKIKVSMKNASDEIKLISNYITDFDNNDDGVARFLEKHLFLEPENLRNHLRN